MLTVTDLNRRLLGSQLTLAFEYMDNAKFVYDALYSDTVGSVIVRYSDLLDNGCRINFLLLAIRPSAESPVNVVSFVQVVGRKGIVLYMNDNGVKKSTHSGGIYIDDLIQSYKEIETTNEYVKANYTFPSQTSVDVVGGSVPQSILTFINGDPFMLLAGVPLNLLGV